MKMSLLVKKLNNIMKYLLAVTLVFLLIYNQSFGQCWNPEHPKTITTKWDVQGSTNTWNWTDPGTHLVYTHNSVTNGIVNPIPVQLPYFCTGPIGTSGCSNHNTSYWHSLPLADKAILPEDGWELVVKDFGCEGVLPGQTCYESQAIDYPYFILYNRHNGRLKTFFLIPGTQSKNGAKIAYSWFNQTGYKTAVYSHIEPITRQISHFNPNLFINTPVYYDNKSYYWLYSEIQTYYDPCGCLDPRTIPDANVPSRLSVQLFFDLTSVIDLKIEGSLIQKVIDINQSGAGVSGGLISYFQATQEGIDKGQKAYKTWGSFANSATDFVDQLDSTYKNKLKKELWEQYYTSYGTQANHDLLFTQKMNSEMDKIMSSENFGNNQLQKNIKNFFSLLPYAGTAISMIDFFIKGGEQKKSTTTAPFSFETNLRVHGTSSTNFSQSPIFFNTPGTSDLQDSYSPHYNNTLGVFGILKAPTLGYYDYLAEPIGNFKKVWDNPPLIDVENVENEVDPMSTGRIRQYKLVEDLKYVLNPNAKMNIVSIDASYVLEYTNNQMKEHRYFNSGCVPTVNPPPQLNCHAVGDYSCALPVIVENTDITSLTLAQRIEKSGLELEYIEKSFLDMSSPKKMRLRTPYVPLNCLHNLTFFLHENDQSGNYCGPKVMVKLVVKMKRNDIENSEILTEIILVEIEEGVQNAVELQNEENSTFSWEKYEFAEGFNYNILTKVPPPIRKITGLNNIAYHNPFIKYPKELLFQMGQSITSDVYAWQKVTIENGVIISHGVNIRAGNSVIIDNYNDIQPHVNIEITGYFESGCPANNSGIFDVAAYHATDAEINTVCTSTQYKQKAMAASPEVPDDENDPEDLEDNTPFRFDVYPNPATSDYFLEFSLAKDAVVHFEVYDLSGQLVEQPMQPNTLAKGNYKLKTSAENLKAGIYILRFFKYHEVFNNKLVIVK